MTSTQAHHHRRSLLESLEEERYLTLGLKPLLTFFPDIVFTFWCHIHNVTFIIEERPEFVLVHLTLGFESLDDSEL